MSQSQRGIGTFVLVFGGVGAAAIAEEVIGALGVAFAFGLSLLAMAYAIGPISGRLPARRGADHRGRAPAA